MGTREEREAKVRETLEEVGLQPAEMYLDEYTSELSGGERQRVGIARAIVSDPTFLVCDEPVSMLDVSIRASILELLDRLRREKELSFLYISHDLSLLKHVCDELAIMYLGKIVESGPAKQVIDDPQHPYTKALVGSTPIIDPDETREPVELTGEVPDPVNLPSGCRFAPRCPEAMEECEQGEPPMYDVGPGQEARCILHEEEGVETPPKADD
jgi:peptide/nickel transport system ATP-binding protein